MTPLIFVLINMAVLATLSSVVPRFTRPDLFFAVTVPASFRHTEPGRRILTRYLQIGWTATLLAAASVLAFASGETAMQAALVATLAACVGAFLRARHAVLPHAAVPDLVRTAVLAPRRDKVPGGVFAIVVPFVWLALKGLEFYYRWDHIPELFPVHWGLNGPDRWVNRTPLTVYGSLLGVAAACATILWTAWGIVRSSRQVAAAGNNAPSERRFRHIGVVGLMALAYVFAFTLPPIPNMYLTVPFAPFFIVGASIAVVAALAMSGQGGTRIPEYRPVLSGAPAGDGTLDKHWKLGMIYFNRSDPALLVERRFGIGWTLNFGHPASWIVAAILLAWPLISFFTQ